MSVAECESCRDRLFGGSKLLEFKPEKQLLLVAIAVTLHPPEIEETAWRSLLWMGIELSCERPSYLFELLEELIVIHGTFRVDYAALCLYDRVGLPLSVLLSDLEHPWLGQDFLLRQQDPCATAVLALWAAWTALDRSNLTRVEELLHARCELAADLCAFLALPDRAIHSRPLLDQAWFEGFTSRHSLTPPSLSDCARRQAATRRWSSALAATPHDPADASGLAGRQSGASDDAASDPPPTPPASEDEDAASNSAAPSTGANDDASEPPETPSASDEGDDDGDSDFHPPRASKSSSGDDTPARRRRSCRRSAAVSTRRAAHVQPAAASGVSMATGDESSSDESQSGDSDSSESPSQRDAMIAAGRDAVGWRSDTSTPAASPAALDGAAPPVEGRLCLVCDTRISPADVAECDDCGCAGGARSHILALRSHNLADAHSTAPQVLDAYLLCL